LLSGRGSSRQAKQHWEAQRQKRVAGQLEPAAREQLGPAHGPRGHAHEIIRAGDNRRRRLTYPTTLNDTTPIADNDREPGRLTSPPRANPQLKHDIELSRCGRIE
jgi:hypothetical protein